MKTVRLPIYDEDGLAQPGYLEVDLLFFISASTSKFKSSQARVVQPEEPMAEWEKELQRNVIVEESAQPEDVEWRELDGLPTKSFQINKAGDIRHKFNQKVIEPSLDLDSPYYMTVNLKINGVDYWIQGPRKAAEMWKEDNV